MVKNMPAASDKNQVLDWVTATIAVIKSPTKDQIISWVTTTTGVVGAFAMSHNWGDAELWGLVGSVAAMITPYVWGLYIHSRQAKIANVGAMSSADQHAAVALATSEVKIEAVTELSPSEQNVAFHSISDGAKMAAVEALPDVRRIVVAPDARDGVATAANDPGRPKVTKDN
jgi:hypothetical protein